MYINYILKVCNICAKTRRALLPVLGALALLLLTLPPPSAPPDPTPRCQPLALGTSSAPAATYSTQDAETEVASFAANSNASAGVQFTWELMVEGHKQAHPALCPARGANIKVLILVMSAPGNFVKRKAIRMSWGHFALRTDVAFGFVLGEPAPAHRQQIDKEDALFGDIIEGYFVDAYKTLTLKTLSMLEWAETHCPRARTLLKADDDVFINVPLLLQFVDNRPNATNTIWGNLRFYDRPDRQPKSKYYLSPAQYPGRKLPVFATGPAYLVTRDAVPQLRAAAPSERYLFLEDVFFTGVLASRLNITRTHSPLFYNDNKGHKPGPCRLKHTVSVNGLRPRDQMKMWMKLNNATSCYIPLRVIPLICPRCKQAYQDGV